MTNNIGVIFDCDGILLDSMSFWRSLDDRLAALAHVTLTPSDKDYLTTCSLPESALFMHETYGLGASASEVKKIMDDTLIQFYDTEATAKPGAREMVEALYDAEIPMAVASSTPALPLRAGLEHVGLAPYMKSIVSVDDVGFPKRHPHVYDKARESLGCSRCETWGFEDALYAIKTLKGAGYKAFAVFDSPLAGKPEDLQMHADRFAMSFEDIDPHEFIEHAVNL